MKKLIYTIVLFIIVNSSLVIDNCQSQWVNVGGPLLSGATVSSLTSNGNYIFAGTSNGLYFSSNNGNNWSASSLNNFINDLEVFGTKIFAATNAGVYSSTNNGANWALSGLSGKIALSLKNLGANIFAGTNNKGTYISTNNGTSWNITTLDTSTHVFGLGGNGNTIFAGVWAVYNTSGIYISQDNGGSWILSSDLNGEVPFYFATSGNNNFVGTANTFNNGGIYYSSNAGLIWSPTAMINREINSLTANGNYVFAGLKDIGVYISSNNGVTWVPKNQGFNIVRTIRSLLVANNYVFAGAVSNSIWRRSFTEIINIQNISTEIPSSNSLSQNYPNPFNPITKIKFDVVLDSRFRGNDKVLLVVYDVMGREMQTLVNESLKPGTYEVTFDGLRLTSGVYFYKLTSGDFSETKRMLLVK